MLDGDLDMGRQFGGLCRVEEEENGVHLSFIINMKEST